MTAQLTQTHVADTTSGKVFPLTLLPDETVLFAWDGLSPFEELAITTHRVRHSWRARGERTTISMLLDDVTSCTIDFRSRLIFIVWAVLSFIGGTIIGGIVADSSAPFALVPFIGGIALASLFALLYTRSRAQRLKFTAAGAEINFSAAVHSLNDVQQLIETVEAAKYALCKP